MWPQTTKIENLIRVASATTLSVLLLAVTHRHAWGAPVALFSLAPWLVTIRGRRALACAASGLGLGTLVGIVETRWVTSALVDFGSPVPEAALGHLLTSFLVVGIPYGLLGLCFCATERLPHGLWRAGTVAVLVFIIDWLRSQGVGGVPWQLLGHTQASLSGAAQIAVLGGVPLISAILVAGNVAIAEGFSGRDRQDRWRAAAAICGAWLVVAVVGLRVAGVFHPTPQGPGVRVLAYQPNVPPNERWVPAVQRTNLAIITRETQAALERREHAPDLVIWPETTLTTPLGSDEALEADLIAHMREQVGVPAVLGIVDHAEPAPGPRYRNVAVWWDPERGESARIEKTRGVPVVESGRGLDWIRPVIGQPASRRRMAPGREAHGPLAGDHRFSIVFCYEAIFADLAARRRDGSTLAILNLANDSWFGGTDVSRQQITFGSFRAIEQRLPFIRVAHGGVSAHVDRFGRVVQELPFDTKGAMEVMLNQTQPPSLAERSAFALLLLGGGFAGWGIHGVVGRIRR